VARGNACDVLRAVNEAHDIPREVRGVYRESDEERTRSGLQGRRGGGVLQVQTAGGKEARSRIAGLARESRDRRSRRE